ncbi:MAG: hypothetical protein Q9168_002843 [Polycauliona sp. 1 TL-2023]
MSFPKVPGIIAAILFFFTLSAAIPHSPSRKLPQLSARQIIPGEPVDSDGYPCRWSSKCEGIWINDSCNQTNAQQAVDDVGLLAHAARMDPRLTPLLSYPTKRGSLTFNALYTNQTSPASSTDLPNGPTDPASHFFWFFENNVQVADFVASVFRNVTACADKHDCGHQAVFCDKEGVPETWPGACSKPAGRYGFSMNPNQYSGPQSYTNGVVVQKGGGVVYSCPAGRELPRDRAPCSSTTEPPDSLGSGLLAQLIQVDMLTRIDIPFLQQKTGWQNITVQNADPNARAETILPTSPAQGMTLIEMGWGINGGGLRQRSLANAQNYVDFAKWSFDMNYGIAPAGVTNQKCDDHFQRIVARDGAKPVTG